MYQRIIFEDWFRKEQLIWQEMEIPCFRSPGITDLATGAVTGRTLVRTGDLEEYYERVLSLLPDERRDKTLRFRMQEDRLRSVCAGLLIEAVRDSSQNRLALTEYGKPYFLKGPYFNLTHSRECVILSVSDRPVGLDLECTRKVHESLYSILSDRELAWIRGQANTQEAFFVLWTRKESLLKCTGRGLGEGKLSEIPALYDNGTIYTYKNRHYVTETLLTDQWVLSETLLTD